jgi:hypothetical protein
MALLCVEIDLCCSVKFQLDAGFGGFQVDLTFPFDF